MSPILSLFFSLELFAWFSCCGCGFYWLFAFAPSSNLINSFRKMLDFAINGTHTACVPYDRCCTFTILAAVLCKPILAHLCVSPFIHLPPFFGRIRKWNSSNNTNNAKNILKWFDYYGISEFNNDWHNEENNPKQKCWNAIVSSSINCAWNDTSQRKMVVSNKINKWRLTVYAS